MIVEVVFTEKTYKRNGHQARRRAIPEYQTSCQLRLSAVVEQLTAVQGQRIAERWSWKCLCTVSGALKRLYAGRGCKRRPSNICAACVTRQHISTRARSRFDKHGETTQDGLTLVEERLITFFLLIWQYWFGPAEAVVVHGQCMPRLTLLTGLQDQNATSRGGS